MAESSTVDVANHVFRGNEQLFLDANVWLLVYGPHGPHGPHGSRGRRVTTYSSALRRILEAKCRIHVDVLVVSEFINAYARLKWRQTDTRKEFKEFRNSEEFSQVARDIAGSVGRVVGHCSRVESSFGTLDIERLFDEYAAGRTDFNDQIIRELCRRRNLTLVTDDGDFGAQGIRVLTANRRLLGLA